MGLFGKKEKIPDGVRVVYYEGELRDFQCNYPCQLLVMEDVLKITKIKPYTEVRLERARIYSIDILPEPQYMAKFKGNALDSSKSEHIKKIFIVVNYLSKEGENRHLDFWGTTFELNKVMSMRDELFKNQRSSSYEI